MTLREYCMKHADDIYVREQIDGKWGSYSLAEIMRKLPNRAAMIIAQWELEGKTFPGQTTQ